MHITTCGQGPDLVMLHGWSMNSAVWSQLQEQLAERYRLHMVDLPGHGRSQWQQGDFDLDKVLHDMQQQLPEQAHYIGWSLGGLLSLALAHFLPQKMSSLTLIAATPRFVQSEDWLSAVEAKVFKTFAEQLEAEPSQTLQAFLMLQARGSQQGRDTIKTLQQKVATLPMPHPQALQAGLDLLIGQDKRSEMRQLAMPTMMILGEKDNLIPITLRDAIAQLNPHITVQTIKGAGHAPFISHADECLQMIHRFVSGVN